MGLRRRRRVRVGGGRMGRRRRRYGGRRGRRRGGGGGLIVALIGLCICGAVAAYKAVSKDVKNTQKEQDQFIQQKKNRRAKRRAARKARKQAERAAQGDMTEVRDDEVNSDSDSSDDEEQKVLKAAENERAKEIQEKQKKLLNEILDKISKEDDPEKMEKLIEQQNALVAQMSVMQAQGFEYDGGLPEVTQWVEEVTAFSSQYNDNSYSAEQVEGPPSVYPQYGDLATAWAPKDLDANQFIELQYDQALYVSRIDIYETFHAGGVKAVLAKDPGGQWQQLWKTESVEDIGQARIFSPPIKAPDFPVEFLRLEVDCTAANAYVEIDAVRMSGTKNKKK